MNEAEFVENLRLALESADPDEFSEGGESLDVRSFEEVGMLTSDSGLVVRVGESEFQVTIVQSR